MSDCHWTLPQELLNHAWDLHASRKIKISSVSTSVSSASVSSFVFSYLLRDLFLTSFASNNLPVADHKCEWHTHKVKTIVRSCKLFAVFVDLCLLISQCSFSTGQIGIGPVAGLWCLLFTVDWCGWPLQLPFQLVETERELFPLHRSCGFSIPASPSERVFSKWLLLWRRLEIISRLTISSILSRQLLSCVVRIKIWENENLIVSESSLIKLNVVRTGVRF